MIAYQKKNSKATEAALKYFSLGAVTSCVYLFGASLIYGHTGNLNLISINQFASVFGCFGGRCAEVLNHTMPLTLMLGTILIFCAICFKISAFPFHMWAPDVYQGAPTIITTLLATAPKFITFMFFIRLLYEPILPLNMTLQDIIIFISIASMLFGNIAAIMQKNIKRLLSYSSIGHVGFALMGVATFNMVNIYASIFYMTSYLIMSLTIFSLILVLKRDSRPQEEIVQFAGLAKGHPYVAFAISCIMFSMAGIPPLLGFFAKFYVLFAAIKANIYILAITGIIATIIGCFYYLYIVKVIYFDKPEEGNIITVKKSLSTITVAILGVAFNIFYILVPEYLLNIVKNVTKVFF